MPRVCEEYDAAVGKMASPPDLERPGAVEDVDDIYEALTMNGLTDKTIVDPAFGGWSEAKTLEDDRETFHRLREFRGLGQPILVSINRKNFLREVAGRDTEGALPVSLAATSMAVERGAHVIRTHDVAETRDAALIGAEFARDRLRVEQDEDAVGVEELDVTTTREAARHLDRVGGTPEAADRAVSRVFELSGLTAEDRGALRAATADTGVLFVEGDDPARGLLFGTPGALTALESAGAGVSAALDDALAAVGVSVE
jgi:dihydropteroate synthase